MINILYWQGDIKNEKEAIEHVGLYMSGELISLIWYTGSARKSQVFHKKPCI